MPAPRRYRVCGVGFDHMHIGDQLQVALEHPQTEVVGVHDPQPDKMNQVCNDIGVPASLRYNDVDAMMAAGRPDMVFVCSTTDQHLPWVRYLAPHGVIIVLEKPFATTYEDAREMERVVAESDSEIFINWPLEWYPAHRTTARLIGEGLIGDVTEVHYYDGNRGPLGHIHGKKTVTHHASAEEKTQSWWYDPVSGGATLDYLGYGATLGTWFRSGTMPTAVTGTRFLPTGLPVDEQSVTIGEFPTGLSTYQCRWGTFTDPWSIQPQPFCGFVIVGTDGTLTSRDFAPAVLAQTHEHPEPFEIPIDEATPETLNAMSYILHCREHGEDPDGPLTTKVALKGQLIVDKARESMDTGSRVEL